MAHMHYKGTGKVHSFRGTLVTTSSAEDQQQINIQGSVGAIAWRITKFQVMPETIATGSNEAAIKIFREEQSSITTDVTFEDAELLAAAMYLRDQSTVAIQTLVTIFDNQLFSRNIWVTGKDAQGSSGNMNYYIELEEVTVSAAGKAQLALAAARRTGER